MALQTAATGDRATARPAVCGADTGEFLAFELGAEEYGVDIPRVQEIRSSEAPTRIANAPAHLRPLPELGSNVAAEHLMAIGSLGDRMLILIDIDPLMSDPGMGLTCPTLQ